MGPKGHNFHLLNSEQLTTDREKNIVDKEPAYSSHAAHEYLEFAAQATSPDSPYFLLSLSSGHDLLQVQVVLL